MKNYKQFFARFREIDIILKCASNHEKSRNISVADVEYIWIWMK